VTYSLGWRRKNKAGTRRECPGFKYVYPGTLGCLQERVEGPNVLMIGWSRSAVKTTWRWWGASLLLIFIGNSVDKKRECSRVVQKILWIPQIWADLEEVPIKVSPPEGLYTLSSCWSRSDAIQWPWLRGWEFCLYESRAFSSLSRREIPDQGTRRLT
jgi:hypothetical protein